MGQIRKTPCKNGIIMVMVSVSSYTRYHFVLLVLYIASSVSFDGIHGLGNQQEIATAKWSSMNFVSPVLGGSHLWKILTLILSWNMILWLHSLLLSPSVSASLSRQIIWDHLCLPCWEMTDNHGFRLKLHSLAVLLANNFPTLYITKSQKVTQCECFPISGFEAV